MKYTIFTGNCIGMMQNTLYPTEREISSADEMDEATIYDHVCARYKDNLRSSSNFIESNVVVMDCDNDDTENFDEWITPQKLGEILGDVAFVTAPSRHDNLVKDGKGPRPRFHVYFPINTIKSDKEYAALKRRIYEAYSFFDKNALDAGRFIFGSDRGTCYWHDGQHSIEDVLNIPSEVIPEGQRNSTLSRFASRVVKRFGNSDKAFELFREKADNCDPPLGETELKAIWDSAVKFLNKKVISQSDYVSPEQYNSDFKFPPLEWDEPLSLAKDNLPEFPVEALPPALRDYAKAVATFTQTPIDMAAVSVLAVASACMRNHYKVEGKDNWLEPTNLYCVVIAEPSERKSAVTALVTKPVNEFVQRYNMEHKYDVEMSKTAKRRLENRRDSLTSASRKNGESEAAKDFDDELQSVVRKICDFQEVKPLKIYVDDITPEKLTEVLADNDGSISLISSEGGIFDVLSGTYSNKVNIDVFLKSYSGDVIQVERINRTSLVVKEPCLTILLSVQPIVISDFMTNRRFKHRGLTARFLYTHPKSFVGSRDFNSAPIPNAVGQAYTALIENILSEKSGATNIISLTDEAKDVLYEHYLWVEKMLKGELTMYGDWLGKLVGNTIRIAGILARCSVLKKDVGDAVFESDPPITISKSIMSNAVTIARYFLPHAVDAYGVMGVNTDFRAASKVIEKVKTLKLQNITRRDVMRYCRWVGSALEAQAILDDLEDYGFVQIVKIGTSDKMRGGRPKNAVYAVNPSVFK